MTFSTLLLIVVPVFAVSPYRGLRASSRPAPSTIRAVSLPEAAIPSQSDAAVPPAAAATALPPAVQQAQVMAAASGDSQGGTAAADAAFAARFDGSNSFVSRAVDLFHPNLPAGKAPAVAARLSPNRTEGAANDQEIEARMRLSPLTNPEREAAVIKLYQEGGAAAQVVDVPKGQGPRLDLFDVVQRQDAGRQRNNLIVVKKGKTDRIIVVGAHHDKVHEGAGTIDNWTGSTMVTNLYQAMNGVETEATFVFVAFSREEEGLLGSRHLVDTMGRQTLAKVDAMVNLDTLAVDGTFSWKNNSDRELLDRVMAVAKAEKRELKEMTLWGGDGDSSSFRRARVAAMTILGASNDVIWDIIHSSRDTMASFSLPHYRNAYLLTLALLKSLDKTPLRQPVL